MSGIDLFVDTNILVNLAEGKKEVDQYFDFRQKTRYTFRISITYYHSSSS